MQTNQTVPVATRVNAIVHAALRRDFTRARDLLRAEPALPAPRRRALAAHVEWVIDVLHGHHTAEDVGLWPLVRSHNPAAGALLDSLEEDHRRIVPRMEHVRVRAQACGSGVVGDGTDRELADAIDALLDVLLPHLEREVAEGMPVVVSSISEQEWHDWDNKYNIKNKPVRQLGMEAHWLLDQIDADGYNVLVHLVPAVPRFILLHGFARAYRKRKQAVWGSQPRPA